MSDTIMVVTNNKPRELVAWHQLPTEQQRVDFDYVTGEDQFSTRFVQYRGSWYDTGDTEGTPRSPYFQGWDLYITETFFSGVLFRFPKTGEVGRDGDPIYDYDSVVVGRYYS